MPGPSCGGPPWHQETLHLCTAIEQGCKKADSTRVHGIGYQEYTVTGHHPKPKIDVEDKG
jgi:hypothetical protein